MKKILWFEVYKCNYKKNNICKKNYCICNGGECSHTFNYKYAKRTPINYLKRIINKIGGKKV